MGTPNVKNIAAAKVAMVAVNVECIRVEKYRPINAKVTADMITNNCETNTSTGDIPPNKKAGRRGSKIIFNNIGLQTLNRSAV